jgi:hypothetical protein
METHLGQIAEVVLTSRARRAFVHPKRREESERLTCWAKNSEELAEGGAPRLDEAQLATLPFLPHPDHNTPFHISNGTAYLYSNYTLFVSYHQASIKCEV